MSEGNRVSRIEEVRLGIVHDIVEGSLAVGTKLANEQGLAERFKVSRSSVREAVSALVTAGYLERRHGSGTYVLARPGAHHALDATLSYTRMIAESGMTPGLELLSMLVRPATSEERNDLHLEDAELVRCLERLRTADSTAVIYSLDVLPERIVGSFGAAGFRHSLYDALEQMGTPVSSAVAVLTPVIADEHLSTVLHVEVGSAIQYIAEVDFTKSGEPVVRSSEWHVPGVFELRVNRRP